MESQEPTSLPNQEIISPLSKVEKQTPSLVKPITNVEEIILEELDPEEAKKLDQNNLSGAVKFPKGTKVKVRGYLLPSDLRNSFDWNGKEGFIVEYICVGAGIGNRPVYDYRVKFPKVEIPFSRVNKETGRLQRGIRITEAENIFDESYLEYA